MTSVVEPSESKDRKPGSSIRTWLLILLGLAGGLFVGVVGITWLIGEPIIGGPNFHGTVIRSPEPAANFTLLNVDSEEVSLKDFRGRVVLLYFGYTY
ncbi:MAG: SCO family protein, partial [Anaerolineales bacterium]|nr:SCO family protein [Anaerolineales bacterium]